MTTEAKTTLRIIAHMHVKTQASGGMTDGTCCECDHLWPCQTAHLAEGWGLGDDCYAEGWCSHAGTRCEKLYDSSEPTSDEDGLEELGMESLMD